MAKCPYCKAEINFKNIRKEKKGLGIYKQETIYSCPKCDCLLGISRGKWTG